MNISRLTCPHCQQPYVLGLTGTVDGCDNCLEITRNPIDHTIIDEIDLPEHDDLHRSGRIPQVTGGDLATLDGVPDHDVRRILRRCRRNSPTQDDRRQPRREGAGRPPPEAHFALGWLVAYTCLRVSTVTIV